MAGKHDRLLNTWFVQARYRLLWLAYTIHPCQTEYKYIQTGSPKTFDPSGWLWLGLTHSVPTPQKTTHLSHFPSISTPSQPLPTLLSHPKSSPKNHPHTTNHSSHRTSLKHHFFNQKSPKCNINKTHFQHNKI